MQHLTLMDRSRYRTETRARDAAWDSLVDGFVVKCYPENGEWVVDSYKEHGKGL